jgi:hypothetical protein
MTELDKAWLETATLKELEDENDILSEEIIAISHQIDMEKEFKGTREKGWRHKAKFAKDCKIADREIIRRHIKDKRKKESMKITHRRDELMIAALREEIGESRFLEIAELVKSHPEWQGD